MTSKSITELNEIIEAARAQKAELFESELRRLVGEIEKLGARPEQVLALMRKGKPRGRPRTKQHSANGMAA